MLAVPGQFPRVGRGRAVQKSGPFDSVPPFALSPSTTTPSTMSSQPTPQTENSLLPFSLLEAEFKRPFETLHARGEELIASADEFFGSPEALVMLREVEYRARVSSSASFLLGRISFLTPSLLRMVR